MHPTRCLVSFPSSTGRHAPCTPPYFLWLSPPEVPPSCNIDEAVCIPHTISFCLFFLSTGQCAPCTPPFFHSFFPPLEAALLLEDQQRSMHPTCCLVWFAFPPPPKTLCMMRWCGSHMPPHLGLFFPPSKVRDSVWDARRLDFFFFFSLRGSPPAATAMMATTRQRESYTPPHFPFLFQHRGGVDPTRHLVLLHSFINEAVCTLHTATFCFLIIFVVTCNFS